jgi:hypothetical protein
VLDGEAGVAYPSRVVAARVDADVWVEWLEHYLGDCRAHMSTPQLNELASALARGVINADRLTRTVSARTAEGGRALVDFLAGIDHPDLRESLRLRAMTGLRSGRVR